MSWLLNRAFLTPRLLGRPFRLPAICERSRESSRGTGNVTKTSQATGRSTSPPRSPAWAAAASCWRCAGARSTSTRRCSAWSTAAARASCRGRSPAAGASAMRSRRILSPRLGGRLHGFVGAAPRLRSGAEARRSAGAGLPRPAPHLGARWRSTTPRSSRSGRGWATPTSIRRCVTWTTRAAPTRAAALPTPSALTAMPQTGGFARLRERARCG